LASGNAGQGGIIPIPTKALSLVEGLKRNNFIGKYLELALKVEI